MTHSTRLTALFLAVASSVTARPGPALARSRNTSIVRFQTDELWLNLHHFLYVLGRAENTTRDSQRDAVRDAPADAPRMALTDDERTAWQDAVHRYAAGPSRKDVVFDEPLPAVARALAAAGDSGTLRAETVPADLRGILVQAAPIYRKAWWPAHRTANRAWAASQRALVDEHGARILSFITHAFGAEWPADGFAVHVSAYANWAGAYSTEGNLLVVSSADPSLAGADGLETVFHEGMHQWDDRIAAMLKQQAERAGVSVPPNLSHALIFFTAGDAVHRSIPAHVPYADAHGVWERGWQTLKAVLTDTWAPYLAGGGTRSEALADAIRRLTEKQSPP